MRSVRLAQPREGIAHHADRAQLDSGELGPDRIRPGGGRAVHPGRTRHAESGRDRSAPMKWLQISEEQIKRISAYPPDFVPWLLYASGMFFSFMSRDHASITAYLSGISFGLG